MKLKTKKTLPKKTIFITLGAIAALVLALGVYVYAFKGTLFGWSPVAKQDSNSINYDQPTKEQKKAGADTKESSINSLDNEKPSSGSDQPSAPIPQSNGKSKIDITITAPADQSTTSPFQLRALIGAVVNSGTCTLTLTKTGSATVIKTAGVQPLASTSTCQGFDVTLSPGSWQMTLSFENEKITGSVSRSIMVQ
jgi:hypothetical protein